MSRPGESGFALVMAVAGAALFAWAAFTVIGDGDGDVAMARARLDRAHLEAAAEAGLMLAAHGLLLSDRSGWAPDGRARQMRFDGVQLTITVEDERAKVPIATANEMVVRRLLGAAGLPPHQSEPLAAAILDWMDADDYQRMYGAEAESYRKAGAEMLPRNGRLHSLDELLAVRGMNPELLAKLAPSITLYFGEPASFSSRTATPLAVMAMLGKSAESIEVKARRQPAGESRPALEIGDDVSMAGRPVTIRVEAEIPGSGHVAHASVVQFTNSPTRPFWLRSYQ